MNRPVFNELQTIWLQENIINDLISIYYKLNNLSVLHKAEEKHLEQINMDIMMAIKKARESFTCIG